MPKTRPYTREELQGLRRADLQRLCKTYDIKGANAKTAVLVEELANYFISPAYLNSPRPRSRAPTRINIHPRPLHSLPGRIPKLARSAAPSSPPPSRPVALQRSEVDGQLPAHLPQPPSASAQSAAPTHLARPIAQASAGVLPSKGTPATSSTAAELPPTTSPLNNEPELAMLRQEVASLRDGVAKLGQQEQLLEAKISEKVDELIKRHLASLEQREAAVRQREVQLEEAWSSIRTYMSDVLAGRSAAVPTFPLLRNETSLKRKPSSTPERDTKRNRAGAEQSPRTPNAPDAAPPVPRTPSPSRGSAGSSRTPGEDSAGLAPQPSGPSPSRALPRRLDSAASPRNWHSRLEPGRRKVSQAHIDLTTITESELGQQDQGSPSYESPGSSSHFLGPILVHDRNTVTPPALSPSPSIGGEHFSYSALPTRGRSALRGLANTRPFVSPGREYMDVALNGLSNPNDSPSALATPSSRTMLGTERYRDTRFGDEPVVPWDTPTVDFGRATPSL
ncbi:uncharacterized protein LOC62_07G009217 [Vanrija pseudolonga]|uniref:Uncharacterized protein n=1 Tax=Vanrija pseudolonga TaxID=143232 RepID=A0AAF1BU82_9TREE|nr:hypothetical protein LOC62_07G009217 [Vanrija pseudolonga]